MFYYTIRDIGLISEVKSYVAGIRPSRQSVKCLLRSFQQFTESDEMKQILPVDNDDVKSVIPFPHTFVILTGHAGTGKSHILKHFANDKRIMFYAPTNPAGINLQMMLYSVMLHPSSKKSVFKTMHAFYKIQPAETNVLGQYVQRALLQHGTCSSYKEYLSVLYRGCKPFCDTLFEKEITAGKLSPEDYEKHKLTVMRTQSSSGSYNLHEKVIEYIYAKGQGSKIPTILLYDTCVLEEAGRAADYLTFLFLFYYYYMHIKYQTYMWRRKIPLLICVGSATQSHVIDRFTYYSGLSFLSQPFMHTYILETGRFKIKCFKDNRRITSGNIEYNTILAEAVNKLEHGLPIPNRLKEKFNNVFVTDVENFYDPFFKQDYYRIAKRHDDLKIYKTNVFKQNIHNIVYIHEYFLSNLEVPSFTKLESLINVKYKSETFEETWVNANCKNTLYDHEFCVYQTKRTCLKGFRYLLTDYHRLYIEGFIGTIRQFVDMTDRLQSYILCDTSNCVDFFVKCATHIVEDIHASKIDNVVKGLEDVVKTTSSDPSDDDDNIAIQQFINLKTLLRQPHLQELTKDKIYAYNCESHSTYLQLPKDIFSFILLEVQSRKKDMINSIVVYLKYEECLQLKMYQKTKSISSSEITFKECSSLAEPSSNRYKRKRYYDDDDDQNGQYEEIEQYEEMADTESTMQEMLGKLKNKSFFRTIPLVLHVCSTIDSCQGLTITTPVLALLHKSDKAEDIIVGLSRNDNPNQLMVANNIFAQRFEPISAETKDLVKMINSLQRTDGYL